MDEELAKGREPEEIAAVNAIAEMKEGGAKVGAPRDLLDGALGPTDRDRAINL